MRPQFSIIFFTTLAGMAQGLLFLVALLNIEGPILSVPFLSLLALPVSFILLSLGLAASFFHLGHPERAWRTAMMWRTSWLSREVIALTAVMAITAIAFFFVISGIVPTWLWAALLISTLILWICTAKIYQCIRFIQEWSHPSILSNFILLGLSSGGLLLELLLMLWNNPNTPFGMGLISGANFILLFIALNLKLWIWRRNQKLKPKSDLASATGIKGGNIHQTSMGFMGGSFNTREFFHHQTDRVIGNIRQIILLMTYVGPMILLAISISSPSIALIAITLLMHYIGLIAERWMFFAEANHPQNLYYQRVS